MKLLHHRGLTRPPHLLVNQAGSAEEAEETSHRIGLVARRFLQMNLETWDPVPLDATVPRAVRRQEPVFSAFPHSPAAVAYRAAAERLWSVVLPPDPAVASDQPQRREAADRAAPRCPEPPSPPRPDRLSISASSHAVRRSAVRRPVRR